ncbi:hypothetical protein LKO27_04360 [Tessaracoccus sp. OS52]|uniref:hypothetical protein n=1 Tax=Tessaracoccus sp. OS52 TaxID=2886691 RepID=UPI001D109D13|nr:hypothetical protein [Tessaracoccus sp. OS52]MCC2592649.1 hypothetical protein [Tessaracoccus sp. OS52]
MELFGLLLEGGWRVLLAGLVLGAGLPAVFAVGIRTLSYGAVDGQEVSDHQPHPWARVIAVVCFAIVLAAVALGIGIVVASGFGMRVEYGWPLFVPK